MTFDLASLGWDADFAAAYARSDVPGQRPARVTRVDRGIATVLSRAGTERASLGGAHLLRVSRDPSRCRARATGSSCAPGRTGGSRWRPCCPGVPR